MIRKVLRSIARTRLIAISCLLTLLGVAALSLAQNAGGPAAPAKTYKRIPDAEIKKHIDHEWLRTSLVNGLTDYWLKASIMPNGFIQENLDREWKPWGDQREASLNGQGRQLYSMAIGYEMSHNDKRYLEGVTKAADFLMKMHDDQHGGYFNRTTPDLKVLDDNKTGFTSFVIYSLATAGRVTKDQRYLTAAMQAFHEVRDKMRDGPFLTATKNRDFSGPGARGGGGGRAGKGGGPAKDGGAPPPGGPQAAKGGGGFGGPGGHSLNVHMFEALLGLYDATKSKEVWDEITAELTAMEKLYDYNLGYLPEGFDKDWKPTGGGGANGGAGRMNTGHLFEWASLFSRAVELGADPKFIELGSRSIDLGLKNGYNQAVGGLGGVNAQGQPSQMLWWPQCEVLKATAHYAILRGRSDLWPVFEKTLAFVKTNYFDTKDGGWFEYYIPGTPREALPVSRQVPGATASLKGAVDGPEWGSYHQTSMYHDLWRITDPKYKPGPGN